ncbi:MAG: carbohydrate ABC transporter permease [SAR202 cluster bacterium]|jgi:raffinose/stachyose/melibiose transport system permease protein|nr:carbohydrate ABC transporter permease [SAR202 cluster bacterium]|tara:strand:+ start:3251 stop:4057 length:807 start_codon:yes stop_codon:yes gene_type:complete
MLISKDRKTTFISQFILTVLAIIFSLPLIVMIKVSLQGRGFENYIKVIKLEYVWQFFFNSIIVSFFTVLIVYVLSILTAYSLSKLNPIAKNSLFNLILIGLMVPNVALVVPIFLLFLDLNLFKSYLAMILPITAGVIPFAVLIFKNYLDNIPNELFDAAKIDGASSFLILRKIVLPLSVSISVVVIIWTFLMTWNDYFTALAFVRDKELLPVTHLPNYFIRSTMGSGNIPDYGPFFACLVLISLPVIILYLLLQKYIEDGITSGSIKQ